MPGRVSWSGGATSDAIVEGDRTVYAVGSQEDREAALDYLFLWYAAGERWAPLSEADRERPNVGELQVPAEFRGPRRP